MKIKYKSNCKNFFKINGYPIAYWVSSEMLNCFSCGKTLDIICPPKQGLITGDNDRFLRYWFEINNTNVSFEGYKAGKKWFPINKGGEYRKWYGNQEIVVNWENDGYEINHFFDKEGKLRSRPQNLNYNFKKSIGWSLITSGAFSARAFNESFMFNVAGISCFPSDEHYFYLLGFLNTPIVNAMVKIINPTLNTNVGDVGKIPIIFSDSKKQAIESLVKENIELEKKDWDSAEKSWFFATSPLIGGKNMGQLIKTKYMEWEQTCKERYKKIKSNEEEINQIFINEYGLENEISPEVCDDEIVIYRPNISDDVKSLISYLIGVEMGRYSLDVEGLAYAGGEWNSMNYVTYQPDDDGIIPIYTQLGMADGLTARIIKLIKHIYGEDTYRENIEFIAEALGKNQNESAEETLNRYLNYGFYADHLKTYQKRPIYWMFSSGKNDAFKCLVYLHRYNEDTLAKINSKYFLNESARLNVEVNETRTLLEAADGREKLRLDKQMKLLNARQKEMIEYGQVLDHMANQYINLDLDDGVKVNYAKFQGIEIVNDSGAKVKKDLLVPIK